MRLPFFTRDKTVNGEPIEHIREEDESNLKATNLQKTWMEDTDVLDCPHCEGEGTLGGPYGYMCKECDGTGVVS